MQALAEHLPAVAQKQVGKGGFLVLRPDSGTSAHCCMEVMYVKHRQINQTILDLACISGLKHMHSCSMLCHLCQIKLCLMC